MSQRPARGGSSHVHVDLARRLLKAQAPPFPQPLALGQPGEGYPWQWSVHSWLEGEAARLDNLASME